MKFRGFLTLLLVLILCPIPNSFAAETLVINADDRTGLSCSGYVPKAGVYGMRLKAGTTGNLTKVIINTSEVTITDSVEIRRTNAIGTLGQLVSTLVYSSYVAGSGYNAMTFTGSAGLTANSEYWIIYKGSSGNICHDSSTVTYTNSFTLITSGSNYVWSNGGSTFNEAKHWSMRLFTDSAPIDTTSPSIPSSETFSIAENQSSIGTITSSESGTITISGGVDQLKFSLAKIDSVSSLLSFITAPNFEIPTDIGSDNNYQVVLRATDESSNSGYETVTVTVTDVDEIGRLISFSLSTSPSKGLITSIIATLNLSGKVTFFANGKRIPGCIKKATAGTNPILASCSWKPSTRGYTNLSFLVSPIGANFQEQLSSQSRVLVASRVVAR